MGTKNKRVAAYLPDSVTEAFNQFKLKHQYGDSQALIEILSEFFGVSRTVTHSEGYLSFVTQEQFSELADKVALLTDSIKSSSLSIDLGEPPESVQSLRDRVRSLELAFDSLQTDDALKTVNPNPGQMSLLTYSKSDSPIEKGELDEDSTEVLPKLASSLPEPINGRSLASRFGLYKDSVAGAKRSRTTKSFIKWTKSKDPEGIAWQFNPEDKLYHPLVSDLLGETPSNQVHPLPEGSERSGEG